MATLDAKRQEYFERAQRIFGEAMLGKEAEVTQKLVDTLDIDVGNYDDAAIKFLLNDVVYDPADNLFTKYIMPPFSVLDTRQGAWLQRRALWLELTGNLSETRSGEYGRVGGKSNGKSFGEFGTYKSDANFNNINEGTSNFDPVLAEVMMRWFNVPGGKILDPFGGEQTKGVVAGVLGYPYWGCEIRQDQVDLNIAKTAQWPHVHYACGDSYYISTHITERDFDMVFTSPPYYDLEVYSASDMSAMPTYEGFMDMLKSIYRTCHAMLKPNRFFVLKVGEIRDKKTGVYRNFVGDTIAIMRELGMAYYDEIILLNAVGTAPLRAAGSFRNRKIVKLHQNVLVFYNGDPATIKDNFGAVDNSLPITVPDQVTLF